MVLALDMPLLPVISYSRLLVLSYCLSLAYDLDMVPSFPCCYLGLSNTSLNPSSLPTLPPSRSIPITLVW